MTPTKAARPAAVSANGPRIGDRFGGQITDGASGTHAETQAGDDTLTLYNNACRAIAEAKQVDEVRSIIDASVAMRAYARQAKNFAMEMDALEIRMRATRRVDQLRVAQKETFGLAKGGRPRKTGLADNPVSAPATLAESGINKNLANEGRKLGALTEPEFEDAIKTARAAVRGVVRSALRAEDKATIRGEKEKALGSKITAMPAGVFGVLYVDPPTRFEVYSRDTGMDRAADNHYPTMTDADLLAMALPPAASEFDLVPLVDRPEARLLARAHGALAVRIQIALHLGQGSVGHRPLVPKQARDAARRDARQRARTDTWNAVRKCGLRARRRALGEARDLPRYDRAPFPEPAQARNVRTREGRARVGRVRQRGRAMMIAPGVTYGSWTIASVDPLGKRATAQCACGTVAQISTDALTSGASSGCGCRQTPRPRSAPQSRAAEFVAGEFASGRRRHRGAS